MVKKETKTIIAKDVSRNTKVILLVLIPQLKLIDIIISFFTSHKLDAKPELDHKKS